MGAGPWNEAKVGEYQFVAGHSSSFAWTLAIFPHCYLHRKYEYGGWEGGIHEAS